MNETNHTGWLGPRTGDVVHFDNPDDEEDDGVVCGSDLLPIDPTSPLGQPFTFDKKKVTCPKCLAWLGFS